MKALLAVIIGASFLVAACNTVAGAGKDVQAVGAKTTQEAADHKTY
jgi:predicted small secreted protein